MDNINEGLILSVCVCVSVSKYSPFYCGVFVCIKNIFTRRYDCL